MTATRGELKRGAVTVHRVGLPAPVLFLTARAPSVARPGWDVGLAMPIAGVDEVAETAGWLTAAIVRADPDVDRASIDWHVCDLGNVLRMCVLCGRQL